jgi:hypothetical protein
VSLDDLISVNTFRMKAAREHAGLSMAQASKHFGLSVAPGEMFGKMNRRDVIRAHDVFGVRSGWLEEEGPMPEPKTLAFTCDALGLDVTILRTCNIHRVGGT